jgi:hypothetical protein
MGDEGYGAVSQPPPAVVGARVVIATYEHKHGTDVRAFQSERGALAWRTSIAEAWWDDEFDAEMPTEGDIGRAYFENIDGEYFSIRAVEVEDAGADGPSSTPMHCEGTAEVGSGGGPSGLMNPRAMP